MSTTKYWVQALKTAKKNFNKLFHKEAIPDRRFVDNKFGKYEVVRPWQVSDQNTVPAYIPHPPYSKYMQLNKGLLKPEIKNENQIQCMRDSCDMAKEVLSQAKQFIKPGVTTDFLNDKIHEMIISNGAYPSPLNYRGFPKSICTSINNVACHGIPDNRPLLEGDTLNIDITVYLNGYHGDCSDMFVVGKADEEANRLINITDLCLWEAIKTCKPNENFSSIGNIIEDTARKHGFNVIPALMGHGIGNYFHGPPDVLHFANNKPGKMQPGMTFTIEPCLTQGDVEVEILEDGWTVVTVDEARTAQIEHTILITQNGCDVLTFK
ncbi:uncharacterized protein [Prorops nasuta]|uniref:uncharacterized protein n=1 Tax=Prorops nasuta TaxID=863751 RepID=UPI0034CFE41C